MSRFGALFPRLVVEGYAETSPATSRYNCIAWAANDSTRFWWPDAYHQYYWPVGIDRIETLAAFVAAFGSLGYVCCDHELLEPGFEKIAIYLKDDKPTHAARQKGDGSWTSKLGSNIDISHTIPGLNHGAYGVASQFMKRPI